MIIRGNDLCDKCRSIIWGDSTVGSKLDRINSEMMAGFVYGGALHALNEYKRTNPKSRTRRPGEAI